MKNCIIITDDVDVALHAFSVRTFGDRVYMQMFFKCMMKEARNGS